VGNLRRTSERFDWNSLFAVRGGRELLYVVVASAVICAGVCGLTPPAHAGDVYRCVAADGSTVYSGTPCAANAQRVEVKGASSQPSTRGLGIEIRSASYVSELSGRALDVTAPMLARCPPGSNACMIKCDNDLAGDPAFGERKHCAVSYDCNAKTHEQRIEEGNGYGLFCPYQGHTSATLSDPTRSAPESRPANFAPSRTNQAVPRQSSGSVEVLEKRAFGATPGERLTFAAPLSEGGFVAATNIRGGASFVYRLSPDGTVLWRKPLAQHGVPRSGGKTANVGYWFGGGFDGLKGDVVRQIDAKGDISATQLISSPLSCAAEHNGSYIQIGTVDTLDEYFRMEVPSLSMTNAQGVRLWQKLIPFDQGRRIEEVPQQLLTCAGIGVTADQHILAAQQILVLPEVKSTDEFKREFGSGLHLRPATLLVALDLSGKEIRRLRHDDTTGGLLIPRPSGAVVIETSYGKPFVQPVTAVDGHIHIHTYDSWLSETTAPLVIQDSNLDVVNTALPTARGGILLVGCSGTTSNVFVRYVSSSKSITSLGSGEDLGYCGGSYWLAHAERENEEWLLAESPNRGSYLARIRFRD